MINIQIDEQNPHSVKINGVRLSVAIIPDLLRPPDDRLFSFHRQGDYIEVTSYFNADDARRFYESKTSVSPK